MDRVSYRPLPRRRSVLRRLWQMLSLRHQRARLGQLDPHLLKDVGLTETQARREASRPFWDAPDNWRI